jgi:hypothetical protein
MHKITNNGSTCNGLERKKDGWISLLQTPQPIVFTTYSHVTFGPCVTVYLDTLYGSGCAYLVAIIALQIIKRQELSPIGVFLYHIIHY